MAWANQSQLCEGKRSLPWAGNEHGDRRRAAGPALTPWEAQAAFYVVHFLQGKLSPWQGPWTSHGLFRTSGSLLPLSCTTRRSAHRWTTWTVCTTLSVPLWALVGNVPGKPVSECSENSGQARTRDRIWKREGLIFLFFVENSLTLKMISSSFSLYQILRLFQKCCLGGSLGKGMISGALFSYD